MLCIQYSMLVLKHLVLRLLHFIYTKWTPPQPLTPSYLTAVEWEILQDAAGFPRPAKSQVNFSAFNSNEAILDFSRRSVGTSLGNLVYICFYLSHDRIPPSWRKKDYFLFDLSLYMQLSAFLITTQGIVGKYYNTEQNLSLF